MKDGEKESSKELLAFFRVIFTTDISILLLSISLRDKIQITSPCIFLVSMILFCASAIVCFYIFLVAVPKIYREEEKIIYSPEIVIPGLSALFMFLTGGVLLVLSQSF